MPFFKRYLYIQISPQRLIVRDPNLQQEIAEIPEIAVQVPASNHPKVLAVGSAARGAVGTPGTKIVNPFAHPRSLISNFTLAELVLKDFVSRTRGSSLLQLTPIAIVHPLGQHEGGLTQVELRAFRELALGAGASAVRIWQGPSLTDQQLLSADYPATGAMLVES